jgi:hypothetical protein
MGTRQGHDSRAIEDLRSYGRSLAGSLTPGETEAMVGRAIAARYKRRRPRALVVALAILGLLAISNVGLAAASDAAVPGDLLYPFDRGYEWARDLFGTRDRTLERLAESEVLSLRGETGVAIDLLREELAVGSSDQQLLVAAIRELVAQAGGDGQPSPSDTAPGQIPGSPSDDAPGQVEGGDDQPSPSDTAPGQVPGSPSDDAPGQNKDTETKDNPSDDAPGQHKDATTTTAEAGNGNGGNGNGNGNGTGN